MDLFVFWIIIVAILALVYAGYLAMSILKQPTGTAAMQTISNAIAEWATAYLLRQNKTIAYVVVVLWLILWFTLWRLTTLTFVLGAILSAAAWYVGMMISVRANVRTAQAASWWLKKAMVLAFQWGTVTGMVCAGAALLGVAVLYLIFHDPKVLIWFGLGASLISLFARVGWWIFTKGADVGADLVGKIEAGIPEDDPRNPAVIADNVGDNVGDCAGMAADLFESYSVTLIATMLLGVTMVGVMNDPFVYPLLLGAVALIASLIGSQFVGTNDKTKIWASLNKGILISAWLSAVWFFLVTRLLWESMVYFWAWIIWLAVTVAIGQIVDRYTSSDKKPTQQVAAASTTGAWTNIIMWLAVGMESTVLPILAICLAIWWSYELAGIYGIAIAAMAMISMTAIVVSVDSFGPITDNAWGIAEMAWLPESVRETTDALDAVGNTTKAVTKGFAIWAAALAALSLFVAYADEVGLKDINMLDANVVIWLFIWWMLPFIFSSLTMKAVGRSAKLIVEEVRRQFREIPGIMEWTGKPDYATCVDISTKAALRELIVPGLIAVVVPLIIGFGLGAEALGGLLGGIIVTWLLLAIMMTTGGGTWDNAKKYIETGKFGGKWSDEHKAAVVGDTVGDPFKDTSGPALNPLIKVVNTVALLIAGLLATGLVG